MLSFMPYNRALHMPSIRRVVEPPREFELELGSYIFELAVKSLN